jgi:hypothetical protein
MADDVDTVRDVMWKMYQEHCVQGRHHETQRSAVAGSLTAIAGAVIAIVTFDKCLSVEDLPLTAFLVVIGAFGVLFSEKQYELFKLHMERAAGYRNALDKTFKDQPLKTIKDEADATHQQKHPRMSKLHLHGMWAGLYICIGGIGLLLSLTALLRPTPEVICRRDETPSLVGVSLAPQTRTTPAP